jgi:predicted metal-dependent peptidase
MFMHAIRRNARDPYRWNAACDYVINWLLAEGKLKGHAAMPMSDETLDQIEAEQTGAPVKKTKAGQMKPVGLIDKKYANMTAEQVYDRLPETKYIVWDMMQDPGKDGNSKGSDATDQAQAKARIALGKALARAKEYRKNTQRGTEPGDWERIAEEGMEPTVSWQNQLQSATTCTGQDTHTWARPNRKYRAQGYYLPSYRGFQLPKTLFVFDTSGSIDNTFLGQMAAELNKLLCTAPRSTITVATCDTEIHVLGEFSAGTPFIPSKHPLPGGGGTDFRAPFEFALKHRYEQIIYLTDTYGTFPEKERLRTIWLVPVECTENIPFGEVITIPMLTEKE